jgi:hypothetical protein
MFRTPSPRQLDVSDFFYLAKLLFPTQALALMILAAAAFIAAH